MTRLYLHCGVHRTGTTLIQTYFANNRAFFADAGVVYPFDEQNHQSIVNALKLGKLAPADLIARLRAAPARPGDALLLSGEDFCNIGHTKWLEALAAAFDVRVIFYLRRQDMWLNSWYNQNVKWPFDRRVCSLSPGEFLSVSDNYPWIDYKKTLDDFASAVGRDALSLGVVEKQQVADILPDFLEKVGLGNITPPAVEKVTRNESVSPLAVEILRHLNLLDLPVGARQRVLRAVADLAERLKPDQNQMVFTPQERRAILARFERSNADVARTYFGRADGRLFLEREVADDDPFTRESLPSSGPLMREIVAPVIKAILVEAGARPPGNAAAAKAPPAASAKAPPAVAAKASPGNNAMAPRQSPASKPYAAMKTMLPEAPLMLAPFDLSWRPDPALERGVQRMADAYLRTQVEQGVKSDFDSRFYKASAFLLPFLSKNLPRRPRRVLEIGCGKGAKSLPLSLLCDEYVGLDIVPGEIEYARGAAKAMGVENVRFVVDEAANLRAFLASQSEKFDLIVLYAVLEHLTPDEKLDMLSAIWTYLDDDGLLFIGEAPNRMHPVDYHSTKSLYFQQMPFDFWPRYVDRVRNDHWRNIMTRAISTGDWHKSAYRHGVHVGHQEFDLALMPVEQLDRHIVADSFDVTAQNLYPLEFFEFLRLAELRSYRGFPSGVQIEPRRFPAFFARYYLEVLLSKRPRPAMAELHVDRSYIAGTNDLFREDQFVEVGASPLTYSARSSAKQVSLTLQLFEPMLGGDFVVTAQNGRVIAQGSPKEMVTGFGRWRRNLAVQLPVIDQADFPIRVTAADDARPVKVVGFVERGVA